MTTVRIGDAVRRDEDYRLLRGRGRYLDDVDAPNQARACVLRSPHAHADITAIDLEAALAAPGVLAILTGGDLAARGLGTVRAAVPTRRADGSPGFKTPQPLLAGERVRMVGQAVAFVVAETVEQARDAAESIQVEYDPCPPWSRRTTRSRPARRRSGTTIRATRRSPTRSATRRRRMRVSPGRPMSCATGSASTG